MLKTKEYIIEIEPEICCELCNDIWHNHFEQCPICKKDHAGTSMYYAIFEHDIGDNVYCEECDARFILKEMSDEGLYAYKFLHVEKENDT